MATPQSQKPVHSIIIDTGPLIKNAVSISTIVNSAEVLYTTPAIISEIRDATTRSRVETTLLPFLNIRSPSPASYDAVVAFAKKTGDFPVLSKQDMGILALAYEMHCEKHGGPWGLRHAPKGPLNVKPVVIAEGEQQKSREVEEKGENYSKVPTVGTSVVEDDISNTQCSEELSVGTQSTNPNSRAPAAQAANKMVHENVEQQEQQLPESAAKIQEAGPAFEDIEQGISDLSVSDTNTPAQQPTPPASSDEDDSDGGAWITPSNLAKHKAKEADSQVLSKDEPQIDIATMTTDFAMQNVLLQMNLHILTTNMQRIRRLRTSILRCHACFLTTKEMDKQFCPRCGQPALKRVSCSTNAKGEFRIHLARNYQYNNRGNRYSILKPVAGTSNGKHGGKGGGQGGWGRNLVLTEDQKEYQRQIGEEKRTKTRDLMDDDYLPGILTGERGRAGGRPKVGAGKNVNSRKRF